jgi:hypothetical protein
MLDAGKSLGVACVGETVTPFGTTAFAPALTEARANNPTAIILNLYGWDLVHALTAYSRREGRPPDGSDISTTRRKEDGVCDSRGFHQPPRGNEGTERNRVSV